MSAVTCIDDGHSCVHRRPERGTLFGMAHGDDVGVVADNAGGVCHGFTLTGAGELGSCKAQRLAAEAESMADSNESRVRVEGS